MGVIAIEAIKLYAYHGVYAEERKQGTTFQVDVYMETDTEAASKSDQLEDTLNYFSIYEMICKLMEEPCNLLERLCGQIGEEIIKRFPQVETVRVKVSKLKPLAMEKCARTYVEMVFDRKDIYSGK